jgi:hypothetical protein
MSQSFEDVSVDVPSVWDCRCKFQKIPPSLRRHSSPKAQVLAPKSALQIPAIFRRASQAQARILSLIFQAQNAIFSLEFVFQCDDLDPLSSHSSDLFNRCP